MAKKKARKHPKKKSAPKRKPARKSRKSRKSKSRTSYSKAASWTLEGKYAAAKREYHRLGREVRKAHGG